MSLVSWPNKQPKDLYAHCRGQWMDKFSSEQRPLAYACAWVEAENQYACWDVVMRWFRLMESGAADKHMPDPFWKGKPWERPVTEERVNRFIEELDSDFQIESNRFPDGHGPEYSRLSKSARLAFFQEFRSVYLPPDEIEKQARARLAKGERLPPWEENFGIL